MKPAKLKIVQSIGDLAIPLLGYFFWHWDFYFILLFYILDLLVSSSFTFVRERKINAYRGIGGFSTQKLLLTLLLLSIAFFLILQAMPMIDPEFDAARNTWQFLAYEDMGIAQGVILLPLVIYTGYLQYKMQFLMTGRFQTEQAAHLWRQHFMTLFIVIAAAGTMLGISSVVVFPHIFYILGLILGATAYRFFITR